MGDLAEKLRRAAQHGYAANPGDHSDLLREAAAALEAAREDAAEAKQNGYELGLLAAAREDAWQPIATAGGARWGPLNACYRASRLSAWPLM